MSASGQKHDYHLVDPSPWPLATSIATLVTAVGSVYYFQPVAYEILKLKTFDSFIQEKEESGNFVVLNITEEDIANEEHIQ